MGVGVGLGTGIEMKGNMGNMNIPYQTILQLNTIPYNFTTLILFIIYYICLGFKKLKVGY